MRLGRISSALPILPKAYLPLKGAIDLATSPKSSQASRLKTESKPQTQTRSPHDQQYSNTRFDNNSNFEINRKTQNDTSKYGRHPGHLDTPIGVCPCLSGLGMSTDVSDMSAICPVRPGHQ